MIGAGLLSRLLGGARPAPALSPPAAAADRYATPSRTELRGALACFDLVDGAVRDEGHVATEAEDLAWAYAEWSLARAAERYGRAYARRVDAEPGGRGGT